MPWTDQTLNVTVDVLEILEQIPTEAIIDYLRTLGYNIT